MCFFCFETDITEKFGLGLKLVSHICFLTCRKVYQNSNIPSSIIYICKKVSLNAQLIPQEWHLTLNHRPLLVPQEQSPSNQTSLAMMQEPQEVVEETVTIEEDPGTPTSRVSVVTSEDGTTRRTETKVLLLTTATF